MDINTVCMKCGEPLESSVSGRQCVACLLELAAAPERFEIGDTDDLDNRASRFLSEGVLPQFKDYVLHEEIARGGMGVVYRAEQISLKRPVAIKLILAGQLATIDSVQRFRTEAEAAAKLDHPGIVPIYEVGQHETQHFFSMKLIDGANLAQRIAEFALTDSMSVVEARQQQKRIATLMAQVARALAFAHERRVLHRDIKPGNILIDRIGNPYLIDFGLAKLTGHDASGLTLSAAILGSPSYMAPEQAMGDASNVTTLADIYGLGAVLYELLTGQPPFLGPTALATMRLLTDTPPKSPSRLNRRVHPDLETIALKCLDKEPKQRYSGAALVADELDRFIRDEPISARRVGSIESLWRWSKRHRVIAGFSAALLLAFIAGFAAVTWQWRRAELTNAKLEESNDRSRWTDLIGMVDRQENSEALAHLAGRLRADPNDWRSAMLAASILDHRRFASAPFPAVTHGDSIEISHATFSPDGSRFATAGADSSARIWDSSTGRLICQLPHATKVTWVDFSPDGQSVVTASRDHTVKQWKSETGEQQTAFDHEGPVNMAVYDRSGTWVASASDDHQMRLWNVITQSLSASFDCGAAVVSVDFGPERQLLVATADGNILIFDLADPTTPTTTERPFVRGRTARASFSHDGRFVLASSTTNEICWQVENKTTVFDFPRQPSCFSALAWNKNHVLLHIGDRISQVMDLESVNTAGDKIRPKYQTFAAAFDRSGRRVATGGWDYAVTILDYQSNTPAVSPIRLPAVPQQLEFSPDDQTLLVRTGSLQFITNNPAETSSVSIWRLNASPPSKTFKAAKGTTTIGAINHRNDRFAVGTNNGLIVLDRDLQSVQRLDEQGDLRSVAFTPDDQRIVLCQTDGRFSVWDVQSGRRIIGPVDTGGACYCYRLSPDGRLLAVASDDGQVSLWNTETGEQYGQHKKHGGTLNDVTFSPDGRFIATAADDHTANVWTVDALKCVHVCHHEYRVEACKFSPDGRKLVTGSNDFTAKIWDLASGEQIGATMRHQGEVSNAEFSSDSKRILTSARDGTARIWDAQSGQPLVPMMVHDSSLREANFSPSARLAVTIDHDALRVWDVESGLPVGVKVLQKSGPGIGHDSMGERAPFTSDSSAILWTMYVPETQLCSTEIPPTPVPPWFPDLLEAIGGLRVDNSTSPVRVSINDVLNTRKAWTQRPPSGTDFYQDRLRKWLSPSGAH